MDEDTTLKPCPFCGGKAYMSKEHCPDWDDGKFYAVECRTCGSRGEKHYARETCPIFFAGVRESWNTRKEQPNG